MSQKQLIINADDFNTDPERSDGILQACEQGMVTSTSVITNLPFKKETAIELKTVFKTSIGIHLNITNGKPLSSNTASLTDSDGCFYPKKKAWERALLKKYDLAEIEKEFCAQIECLLDHGIQPDHVDGNNHIHVFPGIAAVTAKIAAKYRIPVIRLPFEPWKATSTVFKTSFFKKLLINHLSVKAKKLFKQNSLISPDYFFGITFPDPTNKASMIAFLNQLPGGTTELMCHPGFSSGRSSFSSLDQEKELSILTDKDIIACIQKHNIELISFSNLTG